MSTELQPDPLGMTVHSLPSPQDIEAERRTRMGRVKMLLILLACAAPVLASYFTYYVVRPQGGQSNYGVLIDKQPLVPEASALTLHTLEGQPVDPASLKGQWSMVVVASGACDGACEHLLWLQRQVREALGRDKERVERVWLIDDRATVRHELLPAMQGAHVLRADRAQVSAWLQPEAGQSLEAHLYLVDPLGRWMMRFPPQPDAKKLRRDLDRLLRASASWDNEALQPKR